MPVIEHPVHEHGVRDAEHRYGCHNRPPLKETVVVEIGSPLYFNAAHWPFRMSRECRYDRSLSDSACAGCMHAGSGEACAQVCEASTDDDWAGSDAWDAAVQQCAAAIRGRGLA